MFRAKPQFQAPLSVRVPASTSNLGPGFDLLGLALSMWIEVRVERITDDPQLSFSELTGEAESWPRDDLNLVSKAMRAAGIEEFGVQIRAHSEIPMARGLGSSGAAVAAGLLLGNALSATPLSLAELHARGVELEGHPDNVSASLFGGLTLCHPSAGPGEQPLLVRAPIHEEIALAVAWPDTKVSTQDARRVLPKTVSLDDAVENPRRLALLLEGLRSADQKLIRAGLVERLHERYRLQHIPGGTAALEAARNAGAHGACVSGSGSALVALGSRDRMEAIGSAMQACLSKANKQAYHRICGVVRGTPQVQTGA